jgi:hypothetical protein
MLSAASYVEATVASTARCTRLSLALPRAPKPQPSTQPKPQGRPT